MFDKVTESFKVGTFLRHSVDYQTSNRAQVETILQTVLMLQFNHNCFQGGGTSVDFGGKVEYED